MYKPKNLYVQPMDMNQGVNAGGRGGAGQRGIKGWGGSGTTVIA